MLDIKWYVKENVRDLYDKTPKPVGEGSSGIDLKTGHDFIMYPGERKIICTGLHCELPEEYSFFIIPRSGLSAKAGITVVNSPGNIDPSYRGELKIILLNTGDMPKNFERGDRICQGVLIHTPKSNNIFMESLEDLSKTERGTGGLGHTGSK